MTLSSNEDLLDAVCDILTQQLNNKFANTTQPEDLPKTIAKKWLEGLSYHEILEHAAEVVGTKPWGKKRRELSEEDVVGFCEGALGFDYPLDVAAISQFLFTAQQLQSEESEPIRLFQNTQIWCIEFIGSIGI